MANLTTILAFVFHFLHPFYVSVCDLVYNKKNQSVEITHRIFLDDLSVHLSDLHNTPVDFMQNTNGSDEMIADYLNTHFSVTLNGKRAAVNYIGFEVEEEAIWIYQEINNVRNLRSAEIRNTLLMDYKDEQSNLVHFKFDNEIRSYQLTRKKPECIFSDFSSW